MKRTVATDRCTNRCTSEGEKTHGERLDGAGADVPKGTGDGAERFADVLRLIASLPLSPDEQAEAVRRLLAGAG